MCGGILKYAHKLSAMLPLQGIEPNSSYHDWGLDLVNHV